jgi:hypothetical protein
MPEQHKDVPREPAKKDTKDTKDAPAGEPSVDVSPEGVPYQAPSRPREETEAPGAEYEYGRPSGGEVDPATVKDEPTKAEPEK